MSDVTSGRAEQEIEQCYALEKKTNHPDLWKIGGDERIDALVTAREVIADVEERLQEIPEGSNAIELANWDYLHS